MFHRWLHLAAISNSTALQSSRSALLPTSRHGWLLPSRIISSLYIYIHTYIHHVNSSNRLQRVQNTVARLVSQPTWTASSVDICRDLHWLPVSHRVTFKLYLITWKTLHTAHPPYMSELITHYHPSRALYVLPTQIFWPDLPASLVTLPLGHFLFPHHPPRTYCLMVLAVLKSR